MMAKPMKTLEMHYTIIQFLIKALIMYQAVKEKTYVSHGMI